MLAARRTRPPEVAGRWEFPGGKVEPGEARDDAIVRELSEELGLRAVVSRWLPGRVRITSRFALEVAVVAVVGEPVATEHSALRWVGADELDDLDWMDPDRPFLHEVSQALREPLVPGPDRPAEPS